MLDVKSQLAMKPANLLVGVFIFKVTLSAKLEYKNLAWILALYRSMLFRILNSYHRQSRWSLDSLITHTVCLECIHSVVS